MTKYEWTYQQIEMATKDYPPANRQFMDSFLDSVKKAGQSLTRTEFFKLYEACGPGENEDVDYFDYATLDDYWVYTADFSEAWDMPLTPPLPHIITTATAGETALPSDFCSLGGTPEWLQYEDFPICAECDCDMVLFLQLKSLPRSITKTQESLEVYAFGDAGNFYLFHCPKCRTHKTSWECH